MTVLRPSLVLRGLAALALVGMVFGSVLGRAVADDVPDILQDSIAGTGGNTITIDVGETVQVAYVVVAGGTCNSSASFNLSTSSRALSVSPASITFAGCGDTQFITVYGNSPGSGSPFLDITVGDVTTAQLDVVITVAEPDTAPPTIDGLDDVTVDPTGADGAHVAFALPTATDAVDGPVPVVCDQPSGAFFPIGATAVGCSATDAAGNPAAGSFIVTVRDWSLVGFAAPIEMGGVHNAVKGGHIVRLRFEVFAGITELTRTDGVAFSAVRVDCATNAPVAGVLATTSSATNLRYDAHDGEFVQNWKTPKERGACYAATVTAPDGSALVAFFALT